MSELKSQVPIPSAQPQTAGKPESSKSPGKNSETRPGQHVSLNIRIDTIFTLKSPLVHREL